MTLKTIEPSPLTHGLHARDALHRPHVSRDRELAELERIRAAAWRSHDASKNTGTCDFLDILLRVHQCIMCCQEPECGGEAPGATAPPFTPTTVPTPAPEGAKPTRPHKI